MPANDHHFVTTWEIPATVAEIAAVLGRAEDLPRWWPSVYLDVRVLEEGNGSGVGRVVSLHTKGWLPYTLRWRFRVIVVAPTGFVIAATGDLVGRGTWTFQAIRTAETEDGAARGPLTRVTHDWRIAAQKPLLRRLSRVMRPIFGWNHRWAMERGRRSLLLELGRRHATTVGDPTILAALPAPPPPTFPHNLIRRGRAAD